jgi:membrane protease subunit HflC
MEFSMLKRWLWGAIAATLATALVWNCTFVVEENEYGVVKRFGAPVRVAKAGLGFKWPVPIETVVNVSGRVNVLDPAASEYLTQDKKNVIVDSFLAWAVTDPVQYMISVNNRAGAEARLTDVLRSVVGDVLSSHDFAALVSHEEQEIDLDDVVAEVTAAAQTKAEENFGIQVRAVRIKRLNFPTQNKQAVFQRMEAERKAFASEYRSEGLEASQKIKADADLVEAKLLAEADRKARELRGAGEAEAARIYAEAYGKSPDFYKFIRSLAALDEVLGVKSTVVLPADHELLKVLEGPQAR